MPAGGIVKKNRQAKEAKKTTTSKTHKLKSSSLQSQHCDDDYDEYQSDDDAYDYGYYNDDDEFDNLGYKGRNHGKYQDQWG